MKTLEFKPGLPDSLLIRLEADVASKIRALFARCPTLHGFSVQDRAMLPRDLDQTRIPDADLFVRKSACFRSSIRNTTKSTTRSRSRSRTS